MGNAHETKSDDDALYAPVNGEIVSRIFLPPMPSVVTLDIALENIKFLDRFSPIVRNIDMTVRMGF